MPHCGFHHTLSACDTTSSHCHKPGSTEESVAFDTNECEFYAQADSMAESAQSNDTYIGVNAQGQIVSTQMPGTDSFRYMRQADAFDRCMASRRYRSVAN